MWPVNMYPYSLLIEINKNKEQENKSKLMLISVAKRCRRDDMQLDDNKVNYPLLSKHNTILSDARESSLRTVGI